MKVRPITKDKAIARTSELVGLCRSWGELEKLAGIVDREKFWLGKKTADAARVALVELVSARIMAGEL